MDASCACKRTVAVAEKARESGNAAFRRQRYDQALHHYTLALMAAPSLAPRPSSRTTTEGSATSPATKATPTRAQDHHDKHAQCASSCCGDHVSGSTNGSTTAGSTSGDSVALASLVAILLGNRSAALEQLGHLRPCAQAVREALACPRLPRRNAFKLHHRLGRVLAQLGDHNEAEQALRAALSCEHEAEWATPLRREQTTAKVNRLLAETVSAASRDGNRPRDSTVSGVFRCTETTLQQPSPCLPAASDDVTVTYSETAGRYLQARKDIAAGSVVVVDTAWATVLAQEHITRRCHHCLKPTESLLPCVACAHFAACSEECMQEALQQYHYLDCGLACGQPDIGARAGGWSWVPELAVRMFARLLATAPAETTLGDASAVLRLQSDLGQDSNDGAGGNSGVEAGDTDKARKPTEGLDEQTRVCAALLAAELARRLDRQGLDGTWAKLVAAHTVDPGTRLPKSTDSPSAAADLRLGPLLAQLMGTTRCNAIAISELSADSYAKPTATQALDHLVVARGVFPTASLFNHSCVPNVAFGFEGTRVVVRTERDVASKQALLHCYGPRAGRMSKAERQRVLRRVYHFECACEACASEGSHSRAELIRDAWQCQGCKGCVVVEPVGNKGHCVDCAKQVAPADVAAAQQKLGRAAALERTAESREAAGSASPAALVGTWTECERLRAAVLHPANKVLGATRDQLARLCADLGDFPCAAAYCKQSTDTVEQLYGPGMELAHELHKLSCLLAAAGQRKEAIEAGQRAATLFRRIEGPTSQLAQAAESALGC
eukprot:m.196056 g.196056  ORF g.196056 m.196056 type:complete len:782 (-) comp18318_c0_seq1:232-2577(-)